MWCVSNWTVGISLSGICPEPPSPQQPKQHVNIAAILPQTHNRKQTKELLGYYNSTLQNSDAQRWRLEPHKPLPPYCIQSQRLRSAVAPDGMETREENQGQKFYTWQTIGYRCYITASKKKKEAALIQCITRWVDTRKRVSISKCTISMFQKEFIMWQNTAYNLFRPFPSVPSWHRYTVHLLSDTQHFRLFKF